VSDSAATPVLEVLIGKYDAETIAAFNSLCGDEIDSFVTAMGIAFEAWKELDTILCRDGESGAHVSALLYGALHTHVVSMKLFLMGLFVPSGNAQRYVLESLAMAALGSKPSLGFLDRYAKGQYSTTKAIRDLARHHKKLGIDPIAIEQLKSSVELYDQHSHPTLLSLGSLMTLGEQPVTILGGVFDPAKATIYDKEIGRKVSLANILPGVIELIGANYKSAA
jgi:hypothetical protein